MMMGMQQLMFTRHKYRALPETERMVTGRKCGPVLCEENAI